MWPKGRIAIMTAFGLFIAGSASITGVASAAATTCSTSAQFGQCSYSPYTLNNNMWGEVSGSAQTLTASSASDWSITGSEPSGGGVKSYPNNQEDYAGPALNTIQTTDQNFALTAVPACNSSSSWEVAADDWLNGVAGSPNAIEIMVWEDTCHQFPAGSNTGKTITINGQTFDLYAKTGSDPTYSLVSTTNVTSGTVHFIDTVNWLEGLGYFSSSAELEQLNMGEEIVSTNGAALTWTFDKSNNNVVYH
jgi:hypothetical protein